MGSHFAFCDICLEETKELIKHYSIYSMRLIEICKECDKKENRSLD